MKVIVGDSGSARMGCLLDIAAREDRPTNPVLAVEEIPIAIQHATQ